MIDKCFGENNDASSPIPSIDTTIGNRSGRGTTLRATTTILW